MIRGECVDGEQLIHYYPPKSVTFDVFFHLAQMVKIALGLLCLSTLVNNYSGHFIEDSKITF